MVHIEEAYLAPIWKGGVGAQEEQEEDEGIMSRARGQYMWSRLTWEPDILRHFSSSTENFVLLQHFFKLVHSAQCLILTTVALKLPLQSPRKETMRIKRNNYPMSERTQLHFDHLRIYDF